MNRRTRPPKPSWVAWSASVLLLAIIIASYVALAHLLTGSDVPSGDVETGRRDAVYFAIHGGTLLTALVAGFTLGKWLNGLGVAFALLFLVVVGATLSVGQIAAYQAACAGQNDIIRHWTC